MSDNSCHAWMSISTYTKFWDNETYHIQFEYSTFQDGCHSAVARKVFALKCIRITWPAHRKFSMLSRSYIDGQFACCSTSYLVTLSFHVIFMIVRRYLIVNVWRLCTVLLSTTYKRVDMITALYILHFTLVETWWICHSLVCRFQKT